MGRDFPSHVQLDDPKVSRQHVRFLLQDDSVRVEDLGSRNGTKVNGARIKVATLTAGDEVQFGSIRVNLAVSRRAGPAAETSPDSVVLRDARMLEVYALARRAAGTNVPVLVLGETGTGKEHVARTIHAASPRAQKAWCALNCSTIPPNLVESTLFGHEPGAFTGADRRSKGLFEMAAGGTIFLDEVAELSLSAQAALLRVLETKTFQRVGSTRELTTDVRLVAATHCDLDAAVSEGSFRSDLLYRINAVTLELPPLRDRSEELEPLIERFLGECRRQWGTSVDGLEPEALERLRAYPWPGNIRQLRNAIERAVLVASSRRVGVADLPLYLRDYAPALHDAAPPVAPASEPAAPSTAPAAFPAAGLRPALRDYESQMIQQALVRTGGNRLAAAKLLRVPRRTLYRRMQALGFELGTDGSAVDAELESH
jgi:DNA-binding NtrC family response regulator